MIKVLSIVFTFLLLSGCQKEDSMAELLIGKWCLQVESYANDEWIESDKFSITLSKKCKISIIFKDSTMNCESTYIFDESTLSIESPENCANYKIESIDHNQLILFRQGREGFHKYKFKRC